MSGDQPDPPGADPGAELAALRAALETTQEQLAAQQATTFTLRAALDASRSDLQGVHTSLSWKLTRPLRATRDFAAGVVPFLREMKGFPRRMRRSCWRPRFSTRRFAP